MKIKVTAKSNRRGTKKVYASEDMDDVDDIPAEAGDDAGVDDAGEVTVDPDASELLFETEDVAQVLAEATGKDVDVTADEGTVTFDLGDTQVTAEAEGDEEIVESSKKACTASKNVRASRNASPARPAQRASRPVKASRTVRRTARR